MRRLIMLLLIACFAGGLNAQNYTFEWSGALESNPDFYYNSIDANSEGNTIISGSFEGTLDFDLDTGSTTISTAVGGHDIFVAKYDPSGNLEWAHTFGANFFDSGFNCKFDSEGNVLVSGYFNDMIDFDPGPGVYNLTAGIGSSIFILKLSPAGDFIWAKKSGSGFVWWMDLDNADNIYIGGHFQGTSDFDPSDTVVFNLSAYDYIDGYLFKLNSDGGFEWAESIPGEDYVSLTGVFANDDGVYLSGEFRDSVDLDPGPGIASYTTTNYTPFVLHLDHSGDFQWGMPTNSADTETLWSVTDDPSGNVYVTGTIVDPATGKDDVIIRKLEADGDILWERIIGGPANDWCYTIATDNYANVFIGGAFKDSVDFNPGPGNFTLYAEGGSDAYVLKLDSSGTFVWATTFGGTSDDNILVLDVDEIGNIHSMGYFDGTANMDPFGSTFSLTGTEDGFVSKFKSCVSTSEITVDACETYTAPSGTQTWTSSGLYLDQMPNAAGCDSIITVDLTISTIDATVTDAPDVLTANAAGATYQWVDCDDDYAAIPGETGQTFTVTSSGSYAVVVTDGACTDTSSCYTKTISVGLENLAFDGISIYPNPTTAGFVVSLDGEYQNGEYTIEVSNQIGALIEAQTNLSGLQHWFSLEGMAAGVYLIEISSTNGTSRSFKLVKQ